MARALAPPWHSLWLGMVTALVGMLSAGQAASAIAATRDAPTLLVVHNAFVSAEKFARLAPLAQAQGVSLHPVDVDRTSDEALAAALARADLVVLDVPRANDRAAVQQRLDAQAARIATMTPRVVVGGGPPTWEHLPARFGGALTAHYVAGGQAGFARFFALARAVITGAAPADDLLAPTPRLPATGFYHPDAPEVFATVGAYVSWYHATHPTPTPAAPAATGRVALLVHASVVSDLLTRAVDALVRRIEAAGMQPVVFWFDSQAEHGIAGALADAGVDVLVNLTHLQNGAARTRDFEALGIPVIQTLRFREGEAADWLAAPSGVAARTAAVFLAGPEAWGVTDPTVLTATTQGVEDLLPAQADALVGKLRRWVALRHTPARDKRLALMFWNYPAGEKNLGASHLNVPRSIVSMQTALAEAGYDVGEPVTEAQVIAAGQRMLGALYGTVALDDLLAEGLADTLPVAQYAHWVSQLPAGRQAELQQTGRPERHPAVREIEGQAVFVIPRWQLGQWVVMPQMPRQGDGHGHYHDTASVPDHRYLAAYLYLRERHAAHALVHLGTHGTQEWLPGKDRGLAASDYPWLAVGDMPVFYPYIQDNVGEAIQARRRGRAVTVSHQTPPFAPAGLYDTLRDVHHAIHEYQSVDEGGVRTQAAARLVALAEAAGMVADLGWTAQSVAHDTAGFVQALHDHLHELARTAMPLGLHTFGQPAQPEHRAATVMQQLGASLQSALGVDDDAMLVDSPDGLAGNPAYRAVQQLLGHVPEPAPQGVAGLSERARDLEQRRIDTQELESLLAGLAGRRVPPGAGGDPVRQPDVASGRDLYAFEPDKMPAAVAYEAAGVAYDQLVQAFRAEHAQAWPRKLAFSLWSSETIRHLGVTEGQILHALGLRPVWDAGGRVTALQIIPLAELGRPRTDVVVQVTGVYRDQFDGFMRLLDDALFRLATLDEPDNPIAANNARVAQALQAQGMSGEAAALAATARLFGQAPGEYGTGVPDLAMQSTQWEDDAVLGQQFLRSTGFAYGRAGWGERAAQGDVFAEQLRGTQAAVLARSSNLQGVLSTDHPFEFLGGLSAALQVVDGKAPQLLVSDLRQPDGRTTALSRFLADEMRTRYLNPQWIAGMQAEGYAGTLEVLAATNHLFGWQAVDASTVRADQWQALFDTYVADTRDLGTNAWFEQHHSGAQAQILERMAEAMRKGYWDASDATRQALAQRWQALADAHGVGTGAPETRAFIADMAQGFGLSAAPAPALAMTTANAADGAESPARSDAPDAPESPASPTPEPTPADAERQAVQGQVLQPVANAPPAPADSTALLLALMALLMVAGALRQIRAAHRVVPALRLS